MDDCSPSIELLCDDFVLYGMTKVAFKYRMRPIASQELHDKLRTEIQAVQINPLLAKTSEETVEIVLGFKRGLASKILKYPDPGKSFRIEPGNLAIYCDRTGQDVDDLPISDIDAIRMRQLFNALGYTPNRQRRELFEGYKRQCNYVSPDIVAAKHRYEITQLATQDWVQQTRQEFCMAISNATALNDLRKGLLKEGAAAAANRAHIDLHLALTAPKWRLLIESSLKQSIGAFEDRQDKHDWAELAEREFLSHQNLIEVYNKTRKLSDLPSIVAYLASRHWSRSETLRSSLALSDKKLSV